MISQNLKRMSQFKREVEIKLEDQQDLEVVEEDLEEEDLVEEEDHMMKMIEDQLGEALISLEELEEEAEDSLMKILKIEQNLGKSEDTIILMIQMYLEEAMLE